MMRINIVLGAAILGTAFALVHSQYDSRRLYASVDRAKARASELETEHESLRAQRRVESAPARIQSLAQDKLKMRAPDPATTLYLSPQAALEQQP